MRVADFDFHLPPELIAQDPVEPRDASRLMVLHRREGRLEHRRFRDIVHYLRPGDVMVLNSTRVIPARLFGVREGTGAAMEVVLLTRIDLRRWEVLVRPGKKARTGDQLVFGDGELRAEVVDHTAAGGRVLEFQYRGSFEEILDRLGKMPLPPYIKKELVDRERYQTVYASQPGSAAAPTAGLHFTPGLLEEISRGGVEIVYLLLHVGLGTFRPVKVETVEEHHMHAEYYRLDEKTAEIINRAKEKGGRVVAVGTTSVRTLETVSDERGRIAPGSGWTDIFIYPGYRFRVVDAMVTNFHLPRSTLLMLVSAFTGREQVLAAYRQAVAEGYRFFSFGDAMLII